MAGGEPDLDRVLDGAHGHGYLLRTPATSRPADVERWPSHALPGGLTLHTHPRTVLTRAGDTHRAHDLLLLGHPVDVDHGMADAAQIAARLLATWTGHGQDALVREAAYLGGRWTLLALGRTGPEHGQASVLVVPDTHASQPVHSAIRPGRFALGSTPVLPATALGLEPDPRALELRQELRAARSGAVSYLPGRHTAYPGLDPLLPNHLLSVDLHTWTAQMRRFWPWTERVEIRDLETVYPIFRDRLVEHVRLLSGLGRSAVSLTAGGDSRVTAAVAAPVLRAREGFAFTYVNPRDARNGAAALADVTGASAVADQLGLPHRVLRWRPPPRGGTFATLHERTYAPLPGSSGAAHAMWADLPRDLVQLQSNCAETGTTFITDRTDEPLTPLRLLQLAMTRRTAPEHLAEEVFGGYAQWAQLGPEHLLGYDPHDVFYAEQRIGRWGWQKFTDGDLGHRILLPFNDRRLIETMLSLPYELRAGKALFERLWDERPAARLPSRSLPARSTLAGRVPGRPGHLLRRAQGRLERAARGRRRDGRLEQLTFARGYAVSPDDAAPAPRSWASVELPEGAGVLRVHPALPHALAGGDGAWVLVLGEPVDLEGGLAGASPVAEALLPDVGTDRLTTRAAALAGSWLMLARSASGSVVLTDPFGSVGCWADGDALLSHAALASGRPERLGPDRVWTRDGGSASWQGRDVSDLLGPGPYGAGWTRERRLRRHLELLGTQGPLWLALAGDPGSQELASLVARLGGRAVTWWDRLHADGQDPADVFAASATAAATGLPHRVVGLREDLDGTDAPPGAEVRADAALALATTWPKGSGDDAPAPLGPALAQALPEEAVLCLGSTRPAAGAPAAWDLVQGARQVALPFSDRLLGRLP